MNLLDENTQKGTVGEVLVLLRLLIYNVQACFTLKDSGNDLIAILGNSKKAIQVKTDTWTVPSSDKKYDILALVKLDAGLSLDNSKVYLLSKDEADQNKRDIRNKSLPDIYLLSRDRIKKIFV